MSRVERLPARMAAKITVEKVNDLAPGPCWLWDGALAGKRYGSVGYEGRIWSTHRLAYVLLVGPVPDGLQLDHLCTIKRCCNPAHLEPVTGKVNVNRAWPANKLRCTNGHPLVGDNLIVKARANGKTERNCRTCQIAAQRRYRANRKAAA